MTGPTDFYGCYLKSLELPLDMAQRLCEGPVFGEIIYQETGTRSPAYAEYSFKCALEALEHAESKGQQAPANFGPLKGYDRSKLIWLLSPEGQAVVAELERYNTRFSRQYIQYKLYDTNLQFETCQNRLWDETK